MITVNIKRQQGILFLPDDFAILDSITSDGYYHYDIKYSADVVKAVKNGSIKVKINVSSRSSIQRVPNPLASLSGRAIVSNLLLGSAQRRDATRSFDSSFILSINSDISSKISNSKTTGLSGFSNGLKVGNRGSITADTFGKFAAKTGTYASRKTLTLMPVSELNAQNVAHPIHQTTSYKNNVFSELSNTYQSKELMEDLIFNDGVDPSSIAKRTNFIASTKSQLSGLSTQSSANRPHVQFDRSLFNQDMLRASLVGSEKDSPTNQFSLPEASMVNVQIEKTTNFVDIEEELLIPVGSVNDTFYLLFQLLDSDGNEVETIEGVVSHARNLSIASIPILPPLVTASGGGSKIGENVIEIKQQDPNAVGVLIYRRILGKNTPQINAEYTLVSTERFKIADGARRFVDSVNNYSPVLYRVVPFNQYDLKGSDYGSVLVQSRTFSSTRGSSSTSLSRRKTFVSISHTVLTTGIRLEVSNIPSSPVALQLYRRNLGNNGQNRLMVGESFFTNTNGNNASVFFTDPFVTIGNIYEYSIQLIYKDGSVEFSPTNLVVGFNPASKSIINTVTTPPAIIRTGNQIDVTFDLTSTIIEGTMDLLKKALTEQDLLSFWSADIIANKSSLQNLIAYSITRTDITTGLIESFGVIVDRNFSDSKLGARNGVSPIVEDHAYRYTINTHFRSTESSISTFTRVVQNTVSPNLSYTLLPSKWYHPITLRDGNIVSAGSLQRNHSQSHFTFSDVADKQEVSISLVHNLPSITNGFVQKIGADKVMLQWKVQGDIKKVDHFVIIQEVLGMRTIVGKAHNISESNTVQFIDKLNKDEHAELTYYIVPIYFDWSRGTSLKTNKVIT